MKLKALLAGLLLCSSAAFAQDDPVIMTIAGQPVTRSEFEYSYNKNNAEGVIDKKSVEEYVALFVNYKLKVQAAMDAHLDTLTSFQKEFRSYRDQQIRPSFVNDDDMEKAAQDFYGRMKANIGPKGLFTAWHILLLTPKEATEEQKTDIKTRIDSIYTALKGGADFEEMARQFSQDPGSASRGGLLPTMGPKETVPEFEDVAYSLQDGEMSKPFPTSYGYHIIKMKERSQIPTYDSLRTAIMNHFEQIDYRNQLAQSNVKKLAEQRGISTDAIYDERADSLAAKDDDLKNLIREYHDGLLLFEISNKTVWDKAQKDEESLQKLFKANKKKYKWDEPRFKGMAYHVKNKEDLKAVPAAVKKVAFKNWGETLRQTFNSDSTIRIRVEKGIFKKGDNKLIDIKEFGVSDSTYKANKNYPIDATYGKKLTVPEELDDVRGQVVKDYQDQLERTWVEGLRKQYPVAIDESVLATVNKH